MSFPVTRPRRLRQHPTLRRICTETRWSVEQLVLPVFVHRGRRTQPIASLPGHARLSVDALLRTADTAIRSGIGGLLLFGVEDRARKDATGSSADRPDGLVQRAIGALKKRFSHLVVMTDVCLCGYTDHGHCGLLDQRGRVSNDPSVDRIADIALSHALAGADLVAPSDMMDGRVQAIRCRLDEADCSEVGILSYAVKFASHLYGPFREVAGSTPHRGDRRGYQLNPANAREALREAHLDVAEGADIVMIKPALGYQDLIWRVHRSVEVPVACFSVSGEYAMIQAAARQGWCDAKAVTMELTTGLFRAGAQIVITYSALDIAKWIKKR